MPARQTRKAPESVRILPVTGQPSHKQEENGVFGRDAGGQVGATGMSGKPGQCVVLSMNSCLQRSAQETLGNYRRYCSTALVGDSCDQNLLFLSPNIQLCLLVGMSSYRMVLSFHTRLSYLHHSSVGIPNSRHVTEGDGHEPIRDIASVGRAWMSVWRSIYRCGGSVCLAVFKLSAWGQQLELIRCDTAPSASKWLRAMASA